MLNLASEWEMQIIKISSETAHTIQNIFKHNSKLCRTHSGFPISLLWIQKCHKYSLIYYEITVSLNLMCVCFSYFHQSQSERGWMERPDISVFVFGPSFRINCKHRKIHSDCLLLFMLLIVSLILITGMRSCLFVFFFYFGSMCEAVGWFWGTDRMPFTLSLIIMIIIMSSDPSHKLLFVLLFVFLTFHRYSP